jgi:RecG-like helicase
MEAPERMNRLLQGDVGTGKTVVALAAAYKAVRCGYQATIMVPTEILAAQHLVEARELFSGSGIKIELLSSSIPAGEKRDIKERLEQGFVDILIGTHAIIEPDVKYKNLGIVITDEQHRFGVNQRFRLQKKGAMPDVLVMTATPIPRTLAMMVYGDLDVSVLDMYPPGRKPVQTKFVGSGQREAVYDFAQRQMYKGRQVYVVAPLIEDQVMDEEGIGAAAPPAPAGLRSAEALEAEMRERYKMFKVKMTLSTQQHKMIRTISNKQIMHMALKKQDLLVIIIILNIKLSPKNIILIPRSMLLY